MAKKKKAAKKKKTTKAKKELTTTERLKQFENELWKAACKLWTNTRLKPSEYKIPVLALIFLRFADQKFERVAKELEGGSSRRREPGPNDYKARGCVYLAPEARWDYLKSLPEGDNVGAEINKAMELIMTHNEDLKGVLPKTFNRFQSGVLLDLMRVFNTSEELGGDTFGRIYEFFMSEFEKDSGQKGGEFFTPPSLVHLITEIIEPYHGKIYDPACGSGGMFVSSAKFVEAHQKRPSEEIAAFGQERIAETIRIAKMNLAISGFSGSIKDANSYYDDEHGAVGKFDFVMATPPFNAKSVDYSKLKDDKRRLPYGLPTADNANYVWIQLFLTSLNENGKAGFVMASSAADAASSELEIRKQMIKSGVVRCIIYVAPDFFYTVNAPATLWFLDKNPTRMNKDEILFIDASQLFSQIAPGLREFTEEQIQTITSVVKLAEGKSLDVVNDKVARLFPDGKYIDVLGFCKKASLSDVEKKGWTLHPPRYVGLAPAKNNRTDSVSTICKRISDNLLRFQQARENVLSEIKQIQASATDAPRSEYDKVRLGEVASYVARGISPKYDEESPVRVINQKCIRNHWVDLSLSRGNIKKVTEEKWLRKWDVVINSTGVGTLGRVAQLVFEPENLTADSHVSIVRPGPEVDPIYFGAVCVLNERYFEASGQGSTGQTELSRDRIKDALLYLPPLEVQKSIGNTIEAMWEAEKELRVLLEDIPALKDLIVPSMMEGSIQYPNANFSSQSKLQNCDSVVRDA